jgi:hypothetical protein
MLKQDGNRVLSRRRARVITTEEAQAVAGNGAFPPHTNTACMFDPKVMAANGNRVPEDIGEC